MFFINSSHGVFYTLDLQCTAFRSLPPSYFLVAVFDLLIILLCHFRSMGPSGGPFIAVVVGPAATGSCNFCLLRSPLDQESEAAFASQPCRRAVQHGWPSRCNWKSILEGAQLSTRTHYSSREELIAPYTSPPLCLLFQI